MASALQQNAQERAASAPPPPGARRPQGGTKKRGLARRLCRGLKRAACRVVTFWQPTVPTCLFDIYMRNRVGLHPPDVPEVLYVSDAASEPARMPLDQLPRKMANTLRVVIVSDTHERHRLVAVPKGDVFAHCGDILQSSSLTRAERSEGVLFDFDDWLGELPHQDKVVVGGNHDVALLRRPELLTNATLLHDSCVTLAHAQLKVYGNSYSEGASHNRAWQDALHVSAEACKGADIIVSHESARRLADEVFKHSRPRLWASGHCHAAHGARLQDGTLYVNAAIQDHSYTPCQPPVVVDLSEAASS